MTRLARASSAAEFEEMFGGVLKVVEATPAMVDRLHQGLQNEPGHISCEYTVWCGLCSCWHQEPARNLRWAKKLFREARWSFTRKHGWVCPGCLKGATPG